MDKFKNLKPEYKLLIALGALGVLAGIYYTLVIQGIDENLTKVNGRLNQLTLERDQFKDFKGAIEIERLKEQYARVLRQIEENKKVLPEEERLAEFIHSVETDAEESGVTILYYQPAVKVTEQYYARIPISMEVRGSFMQLVRFLKLLAEPGKRLSTVSELSLGAEQMQRASDRKTPFGASVVKSDTQVKGSLMVTTYVYTGGK